jgi:hypothetical protein
MVQPDQPGTPASKARQRAVAFDESGSLGGHDGIIVWIEGRPNLPVEVRHPKLRCS